MRRASYMAGCVNVGNIVKLTKKRGYPAFLFGFTAGINRAIFFNCVSVSKMRKNGVLYE